MADYIRLQWRFVLQSGSFMFGRIFDHIFRTKVKLEILAQDDDKELAEYLVNDPDFIEGMRQIRRFAYYKHGKVAPFITAIFLFDEALERSATPEHLKRRIANLLEQRLLKANSNPHFWIANVEIFGHAQDTLHDWQINNS